MRAAAGVLLLALAVPARGQFQVTDPPARKVLNTPTFLVGAGVVEDLMVAGRYATSSLLVPAEPNEWEVFARWAPLHAEVFGVDASIRAGWNGTAESADGELALGRSLGPVSVEVAGRAFSAWAGGEAETAVAGGVVWRLHRWVAVAADVARLADPDAEAAWSAGLQLGIPYTPHTLSLHASNANAITLQSSTVGIPDRRLWGFEFTVPVTLSRYFGGRRPEADGAVTAERTGTPPPTDTATVGMDNQLRFLPDTVRIRAGQAVRWENGSDIVHTVTADPERAAQPSNVALPGGARPFHSGDLVPGSTYTRVFTVPGSYRYVCLPHEMAGMVGVVVVEGVDRDADP
jgi:plastocyanin